MSEFVPIDADDAALIEAARETLRKRYRPARHTVAAAVRCASGRIYAGINVEACGYGPCAEPIAIGAAFTQGDWDLRTIVAVCRRTEDMPVLSPCGNCRQLILDYAPEAMVIFSQGGQVRKTQARNLLPGCYVSNFD